MTAVLAFFTSPIGRVIGIGLIVLVLLGGGIWAFNSYVDGQRAEERAACDAGWRAMLAKAESDARATIRAREEAAYAAGIAAEAERQSADADDDERTERVIRDAIRSSASARNCFFDDGMAAALNSLQEDAP